MLLEKLTGGNVLLTFKEPLSGPYVTMDDMIQDGNVDKSYVAKVQKLIETHSSKWMSQLGGTMSSDMFFRGLGSMTAQEAVQYAVFSQSVRTDRTEPSDERLHQFLIQQINKCSDGKAVANRHNSAYVTANYMTARGYGIYYVAMPMGDFHYTWHTKYRDMVAVEHEIDKDFNEEEFCKGLVIDKGLQAAHDAEHEVMVHAKSMMYIHPALYDLVVEFSR